MAVFEPRSFTAKTRAFQDGFAAGVRRGRPRASSRRRTCRGRCRRASGCRRPDLVDGIRREGGDAVFVPAVDEIVRALAAEPAAGRPGRDPLERGLRRHPRQAAPSPRSRRSPLSRRSRQTLWNRRGVHAINSPHASHRFACCTASGRCRPAVGGRRYRSHSRRADEARMAGMRGPRPAHGGTAPGPGRPRRRPGRSRRRPAKEGAKAPAFKDEVTVESASKVAGKLIDAPATMSVVTSETLATAARPEHGRHSCARVPGMNVIQTSARDINLTAGRRTSTLANSQLVTASTAARSTSTSSGSCCGTSCLADPGEIKQIEVVRGPASAVWGANALNGRRQHHHQDAARERGLQRRPAAAGSSTATGGSREADGSGYSSTATSPTPSAVNDKWSCRSPPATSTPTRSRGPVGTVPLDCHPLGVDPCRDAPATAVPGGIPMGGAAYPADRAAGASRTTGRASQGRRCASTRSSSGGGRVTYQGGYAGTTGIVHTGHRALPDRERLVPGLRQGAVTRKAP